mmetsp:Transcript_45586/g.132707  ORF Transcript_45586/g.132707 Transcript_45586/m.132707 type:complete len:215 (+) Transcript_45586:836-1480(+)
MGALHGRLRDGHLFVAMARDGLQEVHTGQLPPGRDLLRSRASPRYITLRGHDRRLADGGLLGLLRPSLFRRHPRSNGRRRHGGEELAGLAVRPGRDLFQGQNTACADCAQHRQGCEQLGGHARGDDPESRHRGAGGPTHVACPPLRHFCTRRPEGRPDAGPGRQPRRRRGRQNHEQLPLPAADSPGDLRAVACQLTGLPLDGRGRLRDVAGLPA